MPSMFRLSLALITILAGCGQSASGSLVGHTNELLHEYLKGQTIQLVPLSAGAKLTLPVLVSVDGSADGHCLSVSFAREDLDERFLNALFYPKNAKKLELLSPFSEPGIEAVLTRDQVVFNLYSGVVVRLEPHLEYPGGFTAFKSKEVRGTVVKVVGSAVHAGPQALPDSLKRFSYLRNGKAFAYSSTDPSKQKSREQNTQLADAMARMSMTFRPTVIDQSVDPQAVA